MDKLYGLMAEFDGPDALIEAVKKARAEGYRRMDAFTPYPVEELHEALDMHSSRLPLIVLVAGAVGALGGFLLQYWVSTVADPRNIGGRPLNSWPAFIPVTFETTVLFAALAAVVGLLVVNGLPRLHHPVFGGHRFDRASRDRFFLCIEAADPLFDAGTTRRFLEGVGPYEVVDLEA